MSDGPSEGARVERASKMLLAGIGKIEEACEEVHDAIFGLPQWVADDMNTYLSKFGLTVTVKRGKLPLAPDD